MLTLAKSTPRILAIAFTVVLLAGTAFRVIATPQTWNWKDQSGLLPVRDGLDITMSSHADGRWLLSDGSHLYLFDGSNLNDLTKELRNRGMLRVSSITSDGRAWLVSYLPTDSSGPQLWLTNGITWTDIGGKLRLSNADVDAVGYKGTWYIKTYQRAMNGQPSTWELFSLNNTDDKATLVRLPQTISPNQTGCVDFTDGSHLCTGVSTPVYVNGNWYLIGGTSEARGVNNTVSQTAQGSLWKIEADRMLAVSGAPAFKFVSRLWNSNGHVMIATSNAVSNPYAADHLWIFDGTTFTDVSNQAIAAGLLSIDVREIQTAWNGRSWMIIAGKKVVRFDETTMTREADTRDTFHTISADVNGTFILGGVVSDLNSPFGTPPVTAKFVTATEEVSTSPAKPNTLLNILLSKVEGPRVTLSSIPQDARIGNGRVFTFNVDAYDADGIDHIDIYINGARIKRCASATCEYTQVYWTNGSAMRTVEFSARAVDKKMYANDSELLKLTIDNQSQAGSTNLPQNTNEESVVLNGTTVNIPNTVVWSHDTWSDLDVATWLEPKPTLLLTSSSTNYFVAAKGDTGASSIEIWVNGTVKRTCTFRLTAHPATCNVTLKGSDYPYGTEVYMNANVRAHNGLNSWTNPTTIRRDVAPAETPAPREVRGPVFSSVGTLKPNVSSVIRGTVVNFTTISQNNPHGIAAVDIIVNGKVQRPCRFGIAAGPVMCDTNLDTSSYPDGTTLTFMARAIDNQGHEVMSNAKSVLVRTTPAPATTPTASGSTKLNVWEWMGPEVSELTIPQTTTYTVGAWSANAIRKIEMIVDGHVNKTCAFGTTIGNRECTFDIDTADYSHGHLVTINARVTDGNGHIAWSEPRSILIKRTWEPLNTQGAYVHAIAPVLTSYTLGQNPVLSMKGWAPDGVKRMEIYVDGVKTASCPSEGCSWTILSPTKSTIEYSARLIDNLNRETWSPVYGLRRQ